MKLQNIFHKMNTNNIIYAIRIVARAIIVVFRHDDGNVRILTYAHKIDFQILDNACSRVELMIHDRLAGLWRGNSINIADAPNVLTPVLGLIRAGAGFRKTNSRADMPRDLKFLKQSPLDAWIMRCTRA